MDANTFENVKYEDLVEFFDNIKLPNFTFTFSHDQFCEIKGLAFKDVIDSMQQVNNLLIEYINRLEQTT